MSDIDFSEEEQKFYKKVNGGTAELNYRFRGDVMEFYSTFTPEEARGEGVQDEIVTEAFGYAKANGYKVDPICPYISGTYLNRHPEWKGITTT